MPDNFARFQGRLQNIEGHLKDLEVRISAIERRFRQFADPIEPPATEPQKVE